MATARNPPEESRRDRTTRLLTQSMSVPRTYRAGHTHVHVRVLLGVAARQVLIDVGENSLAHTLDIETRGIDSRDAGCRDHEL